MLDTMLIGDVQLPRIIKYWSDNTNHDITEWRFNKCDCLRHNSIDQTLRHTYCQYVVIRLRRGCTFSSSRCDLLTRLHTNMMSIDTHICTHVECTNAQINQLRIYGEFICVFICDVPSPPLRMCTKWTAVCRGYLIQLWLLQQVLVHCNRIIQYDDMRIWYNNEHVGWQTGSGGNGQLFTHDICMTLGPLYGGVFQRIQQFIPRLLSSCIISTVAFNLSLSHIIIAQLLYIPVPYTHFHLAVLLLMCARRNSHRTCHVTYSWLVNRAVSLLSVVILSSLRLVYLGE